MKHLLKLFDAIFLARPLLLVPVWGFCIFGYYQGSTLTAKVSIRSLWTLKSTEAFVWLILFSFSVASVYVLNQIADIEVDKANGGLPLLAQGKVSRKTAWIAACVYAIVGIAAPAFKYPFLSLLASAALLLGIFYSFRPLRLSGRCGFDFLANAAGYGIIAFSAGWIVSGAPLTAASFPAVSLSYFLLMCAGSISSTIPDYPGDKQYGKKTTAVVLGIMNAHLLATFFLCLTMIVAIAAHLAVPLACALCAFPFYILYFFKRDARIMEATYKIGGACCMLFASIVMPLMGIAAIAVAVSTRIYFRKRHRMAYPSLIPTTHED
jgi:4-hydroxybenzoate polyprenyltransferase